MKNKRKQKFIKPTLKFNPGSLSYEVDIKKTKKVTRTIKKVLKKPISKKIKRKLSWFKTKIVMGIFSALFFTSGILFINKKITGNVVIENSDSLNLIPIVGILLILCSAILVFYSIKKR